MSRLGTSLIVLPCLLALAACGRGEAPAPAPEKTAAAQGAAQPKPEQAKADPAKAEPAKAAAGKKQFGAAITEQTTTALGDIVREPAKFSKKTVRTEGSVKAVCQEAGCWMEIEDPNGLAHVKMAGHAFAVPRDSSGRRAMIQGTVIAPEAPKDHCSGEAEAVTGQVAKVSIEATGVELLD